MLFFLSHFCVESNCGHEADALLFGLMCVFLCFRCVPVCSAHMLSGSALYVHVHGDGNLPIHTEEAAVKR